MTHTIPVVVRSYELDSYGHVNNAVYLNYLEYARMEFLKRAGFDYVSLINDGYMLYVTHIDIRYKYSARLHDTLSIDVTSTKLGKLSGVFLQVVKNQDGQVCAEAEVSWGCVDKSGKPSKLPDAYFVPDLLPKK